jgi:TRAP-type transport system small permease protein
MPGDVEDVEAAGQEEPRRFHVLDVVITILVALSAVLVITQVTLRYVFSAPSPFTEELARLSLIWLTFIGAAVVTRRREMLRVTYFVERLPRPVGRVVSVIAELVGVGVMVYVLTIGLDVVPIAHGMSYAGLGWPRSVAFVAAPVGFALTLAIAVNEARIALQRRRAAAWASGRGDRG